MLQSGAAPVPFITMMRPGGFKGSASFSTAGTWCIHKTAVSGQQLFSQVNILLVTTANRGYLEERGLKAQQEYNTFPEHSLTPICIRGIYILRRNFFFPESQVAFWTARSFTTLFSLHIHMYLQPHKELSLFYKEMVKTHSSLCLSLYQMTLTTWTVCLLQRFMILFPPLGTISTLGAEQWKKVPQLQVFT